MHTLFYDSHVSAKSNTGQRGLVLMLSLFLLCSTRRTVKKSLLEEVQELEARAVDPGAAVLRDASGRRYVRCCSALVSVTSSHIHFYQSICFIGFCPIYVRMILSHGF